ncbi:LacI family DNA-binding transcriptional regulator [Caulobacter sp.]|uniref:LacI family DNA-binding transcriptional regulator n=1 Tax=Caulobacter sp. TaxID=78 RepID=UPI002B4A1C2A|nr:substrate-binding domain-containing protein [Caulobacter sp.]HJV41897.1 substrate-binding domain-containing protein [Caulobacter sp.]
MADIARMAGVSISTVSRALAGNPLIPKTLRDQIVELAQTHGYVVNQSARSLRLRKTDTIGVIIPLAHEAGQMISDPFFLEMVGRLADEITRRDYSVLLNKIITTEPGWLERIIQSHRADGLLLIGQSTQHEALNAVANTYRPMVVWGAQLPGQTYCSVGSDNVEGGRLAVAHLAAGGRRRIVFLGAIDAPEAAQRFVGYRKGLEEAGIAFDPALVVPAPYTVDEAQKAVTEFLASGAPFDAIFAFSDVIALAALRALAKAGRRVPADVAVVGFDDIVLAQHSTPPLTTVCQDLASGARAMVDLLFRRMAGQEAPSTLSPVRLVVRESA